MRMRSIAGLAAVACALAVPAAAQGPPAPLASQYVDPVNGTTLDQAIQQALDREPSFRAARTEIDVARGVERQAALRANPTVSLERREQVAGADTESMAALQWPLELFRRGPRIEVAARERAVVELTVADRARLLAADARARYGELLVAIRDLSVLDELVASVARQHDLLSARVAEGASPALDRDLLEVELRRWQADRLLQAGRTDAALLALKRALGLAPDSAFTVRDDLVTAVVTETPARLSHAPVDQRADVQAAAARIVVAEARGDLARRGGRFDVGLFASYSRMQAGFMQRGFGPDGHLEPVGGTMHYLSGGVMLMLPLFDRNQGDIAAAAAQRAGATAALEATRLEAASELASAQAADARARAAVGLLSGGARDLALRNLDIVRQTYALGRATVFDVLAEQRRYLEFERAYTDALRMAFEARTALLKASGGVR
jgi:cobalt-zinc-cadmium efflux system outer membrane protein